MSVRRIADHSPVEHEWTGNDASGRHHHVVLTVPNGPLTLGLHWKRSGSSTPFFIGNFEIDLPQLLDDGYAKWKDRDANQARLRIEHSAEGLIRIARTQKEKGLTIGWLKE